MRLNRRCAQVLWLAPQTKVNRGIHLLEAILAQLCAIQGRRCVPRLRPFDWSQQSFSFSEGLNCTGELATMSPDLLNDDHFLNNNRPNLATLTVDDMMTRAMALNLADWTDCSVRAFGISTARTKSLWWRKRGHAPIYLPAIIVDGQTADDELFSELRSVEEVWASTGFDLYECWGKRDLSQIGFEQRWKNPWYLRSPGGIAEVALPAGLSIEIVTTGDQLAEFERASWEGFEEPEEEAEVAFRDRQPLDWHARSTLDVAGMYYLVARLDGQVVAGVIAHVTQDMVGIYGLSTLSRFRRRGYATALVRASVALRSDLPSGGILPRSAYSSHLHQYRGSGEPGEIAVWKKP